MSVNIPDHFYTQYNANVAMLLRVEGGLLRSKVMRGQHSGEKASVLDQFGAGQMQEVVGQFAPMPRIDIEVDRRWVHPTDYEFPQMVDTFDKLRTMTDPKGPLSQAAVDAVAEKEDEIIFDAFFGSAFIGKNGTTSEAFDDTNHRVDAAVGAAADTGLNADKVLRGVRLLLENNVKADREEIWMAITPQQHEDLLRETQVINTDYFSKMGKPVLEDGFVKRWGGVNFVISNLVQQNSAGTYRLCPMWVKSGMHLGVWKEPTSSVDIRADISGRPYQLYTYMTMGATRTEPGRVIKIECTE